jgi:hypothetical protein
MVAYPSSYGMIDGALNVAARANVARHAATWASVRISSTTGSIDNEKTAIRVAKGRQIQRYAVPPGEA